MRSKGYIILWMLIGGLLLLSCKEKVEPGKIEREGPFIRGVGVITLSLETIPCIYEAICGKDRYKYPRCPLRYVW